MTKLLVNSTRNIVYSLWLQNSGYIYSGIIIPVNVRGKYSKSSFKIRRWQRYYLHILAPVRFSLYMQASAFVSRGATPTTLPFHCLSGKVVWSGLPLESLNAEDCIHFDTGFLLVMLCILHPVSNYFYKVP